MKIRKNFRFLTLAEIYFQHLDRASIMTMANVMFCAGEWLCRIYLLQSREKRIEISISSWSVLQPTYIESAIALSDIMMNYLQLWLSAIMNLQCSA